jgi:hypothetical protein
MTDRPPTIFVGHDLVEYVRADVVEGRVREAVKKQQDDTERRLTAKYHAALPVFVRNPQNSALWPMTSLRAAQECAERARWEEREACAALCGERAKMQSLDGDEFAHGMQSAYQLAERAIRTRGAA